MGILNVIMIIVKMIIVPLYIKKVLFFAFVD